MKGKIVTVSLTLIVIGILLLSAPAKAVQITMGGDSDEDLSTSSTLAVASINATINIESEELISLQNYTIKITNGSTLVECSLYLNGTEISGCDYIDNAQVTYNSANYSYGDLYGYGYTSSGSTVVYGSDSGYGYGYGNAGISNEIVITFDWEFQKQSVSEGNYNINLEATALNDEEIKTFASTLAQEFTVNSVSADDTISSSVNTASAVDVTIGGSTVEVPMNYNYVATADMGSLSTYLKGIVGATGNVIINMSIGAPVDGVTASDVTVNSADIIFLYFTINATIDSDSGYADIYFSIPKEIIDAIDDSNALSKINAYVKHDDLSEEIYGLSRASNLDTTTEYIFRLRLTEFSDFALFYDQSGGISSSGGGTTAPATADTGSGIAPEEGGVEEKDYEEETWPPEKKDKDKPAAPIEVEDDDKEEKQAVPLGTGIFVVLLLAATAITFAVLIKKRKNEY